MKKRQACPAMNNLAAPRTSPQLPQTVSRVRSKSTSKNSPPSITRKRTSSGVFQVDESEPLTKKVEVSPTLPKSPRKHPDVPNGRQKKTENDESGKQECLEIKTIRVEKKKGKVDKKTETLEKQVESVLMNKDKVIEKFDSKAKSKCVSAFKESDSWD